MFAPLLGDYWALVSRCGQILKFLQYFLVCAFVTPTFYPWDNLIVLSLAQQLLALPPWNPTRAGYGLVCFEGGFLGSPHWLLYQSLPTPPKADGLGTVVGEVA